MRASGSHICIWLLSTVVAMALGCASAPPAPPPRVESSAVPPDGALDGGPVDEDAVPLTTVPPTFPEEAKQLKVSAMVELQVLVDEQGSPSEITVVRSAPPFDEAAIEAVRRWRFKPAMRGGRPIAVRVRVPIGFRSD